MNFVSYANAETLMTAIVQKFNALGGAYVAKGSKAFAELPSTRTADMVGYVYNVTDDFTTTADFVEGAGKKYPAGTNVVIVDASTAGSPDTYLFDVLGNFIDIDAIEARIDAVADMISGEFATTEAYSIGDVVIYEGKLYKFKSAHTAGAWDATEVDKTTVIDLIKSAEPDALTTEQVNGLIALLG
jgi:hypothetical protein